MQISFSTQDTGPSIEPDPTIRVSTGQADELPLARMPAYEIGRSPADRPMQRAASVSLRAGDIVETDRNGVNCRAWMSTSAPVRTILDKGVRATLLSEPFRFDGHHWVRLRLDDSEIVGCVSARYLELVERGPDHADGLVERPGAQKNPRGRQEEGATLITISRLSLRLRPGIHFPAARRMEANSPVTVLGEPIIRDSSAWIPVRFSTDSGWVAAQHTVPLVKIGKWIEAERTGQMLTLWDGASCTRRFRISTGKRGYPTPEGVFSITKKIPVRTLRGSVRGERWEIPGVPWIMIFRRGGFYFHAAYWHNDFGQAVSHGCITLSPGDAEWLYDWTPLDTPVWVHDAPEQSEKPGDRHRP